MANFGSRGSGFCGGSYSPVALKLAAKTAMVRRAFSKDALSDFGPEARLMAVYDFLISR